MEMMREQYRQWREESETKWDKWKAEQAEERAERERVRVQEQAERDKRWAREQKRLDRELAKHGDRIGDLICAMIEAGLYRLFKKRGYEFTGGAKRGWEFGTDVGNSESKDPNRIHGEVDFYLENPEVSILVEVKTKASQQDVMTHIERLEKFRKVCDVKKMERKVLGAIGGGIIPEEVEQFALKQGMFVIKQSGERVKLLEPEGGPKVW
jgi:hypothetical protein